MASEAVIFFRKFADREAGVGIIMKRAFRLKGRPAMFELDSFSFQDFNDVGGVFDLVNGVLRDIILIQIVSFVFPP